MAVEIRDFTLRMAESPFLVVVVVVVAVVGVESVVCGAFVSPSVIGHIVFCTSKDPQLRSVIGHPEKP